MNHWIVIFQDSPEMLARREQHFSAHVAYLTSRPEIFVDGASLSKNENSPPSGGIWIVQARNRADIVHLIEADPMFHPELRTYQIFATNKRLSIA